MFGLGRSFADQGSGAVRYGVARNSVPVKLTIIWWAWSSGSSHGEPKVTAAVTVSGSFLSLKTAQAGF